MSKKEKKQYVLLEARFTQGDMHLLKEIALFDSLAEAQKYYEAHPEYRTSGHHWSGLTRYQIMEVDGENYRPLSGEKDISHGAICEPRPHIIRLER